MGELADAPESGPAHLRITLKSSREAARCQVMLGVPGCAAQNLVAIWLDVKVCNGDATGEQSQPFEWMNGLQNESTLVEA